MTGPHHDFHWEGPAERDRASEVRRAVRRWCADVDLPADLCAELTLASYEAMANAIEHAYPEDQPGPLSVRISHDDAAVVVVVADQGQWCPDPSGELRGRGLVLMAGLATELALHRTTHGTAVEMRWPAPSS